MVRYFYAWTPFFLVGTAVLLSLPWLGPVALVTFAFIALVALAALAWAIVAAPYLLIRAIAHRWHEPTVAHRPSAALSLLSVLGSRSAVEKEVERYEWRRQQ